MRASNTPKKKEANLCLIHIHFFSKTSKLDRTNENTRFRKQYLVQIFGVLEGISFFRAGFFRGYR